MLLLALLLVLQFKGGAGWTVLSSLVPTLKEVPASLIECEDCIQVGGRGGGEEGWIEHRDFEL